MIQPPREERAAVARPPLQFDFEGKRVRLAPRVQQNPPLSAEPDDHPSAIQAAIVRWLNEK